MLLGFPRQRIRFPFPKRLKSIGTFGMVSVSEQKKIEEVVGMLQRILRAMESMNEDWFRGEQNMLKAAKKGDCEAVRALLDAGAHCDAANIFGLTPLAWAVQKKHTKVAKLLCDAGANPNSFLEQKLPLLCFAAKQGLLEMAQVLIEAGADVEAYDNKGMSPISIAVDNNFEDLARCFIEAGANPNVQNFVGTTPLHRAAHRRSSKIVELLLHAGADPNAFDFFKETALYYAVRSGRINVVKLLIDAGAEFNDTPEFLSPLYVAITQHKQHTELVKVLVDAGADVNFTYSCGGNPLHTAARERKLEVMKLLLDAGARLPSGKVHGERDGPNFSKEVQELILSYPQVVTLRTLCLRSVRKNKTDPQFLPPLVFLQPDEVEEHREHCKRKRDFEENNPNKKR